ncbi:MAG: lipocalin-like domain-containing protein [Bacteroidaceae bacterium]|jgi:hypothetical protein|nr:lipocalin-like domain-containing protein [Bacteroidaceae bacterium]HAE24557.1 hypothetical protein [Prevotellaceae bacterium]
MKKISYILTIFSACVLSFQSCHIESSDNGKLDGFWYAESIDSISGGKADVYDDCYWAFQFDLLSIRHIETQEQYLFHFTCRSDSLLLSEPYKAIEQGLDSLLPDNRELLPLGVQSLEEGFKIIELNDKRMKLQSAVLRLSLRKM